MGHSHGQRRNLFPAADGLSGGWLVANCSRRKHPRPQDRRIGPNSGGGSRYPVSTGCADLRTGGGLPRPDRRICLPYAIRPGAFIPGDCFFDRRRVWRCLPLDYSGYGPSPWTGSIAGSLHKFEKTRAAMDDVFLIVGLGNPGREYSVTRHNIGFRIADQLTGLLNVRFSRQQNHAFVASGVHSGKKVILAKPQTFMNLSGGAVAGLMRFYKVPPERLLVACDDIDLPFGALRIRASGGSAGQRGMQSILDALATREIPRLRFGVGRPPGRMDAADYVLRAFDPGGRGIPADPRGQGSPSRADFRRPFAGRSHEPI